MKVELLTSPEDLDWLKTTALRSLDPPPFRSALVCGNDDAPRAVSLFASQDPEVGEQPVIVYASCERCGGLRRTDQSCGDFDNGSQ